MDADALKRKAELLASSAAKLSRVAGAIPSDRDFHFFSNFPEFKSPSRDLARQSESLLRTLSSSTNIWGQSSTPPPPLPADLDDAYDWLVGLNDDLLERFAVSMDEFKSTREKEEAGAKLAAAEMEESGFQLVGKKKRRDGGKNLEKEGGFVDGGGSAGVKVVTRDKKTSAARSRVPFHIPTIPRPQDQYNILVNNSNQPFEHVWLEQSEDGSRFVHPLEKLSILDFVDRNVGEGEPVQPLPLESTPFKFVEGVKELKELAAKLLDANEFAVDLEHNRYRSFQGLTCLMQVSTRTEDFVIDTLKLRIHIGPYLREVFKDPSKRKVMHGADHDIVWLQRDFGIYVCNLFDTGQASRILQLERNSLEYLLRHFCGVNANKEYQNADWRLRPLPNEMLKYAREDTHYLLHIYDLMRIRLLSASSDENDLLLGVYKRSFEICMQLYEKELLTDTSYLYIYGLQEADFDGKQLAVVAGLCEWRDNVARAEDESTGYILPNKALLEIARQMPLSSSKLRQLVKFKHPFVERSLNSVVSIIRSSVENSSGLESIAEQLRKARSEKLLVQNTETIGCNSESTPANEDSMVSSIAQGNVLDDRGNTSTTHSEEVATAMNVDHAESSIIEQTSDQVASIFTNSQEQRLQSFSESEIESSVMLSGISETTNREKPEVGFTEPPMSAKRACVASVQILKKPTCAFGALLGSTSRRKFNPHKRGIAEQDKNECKVERIKSSVSLPFHSFAGGQKHTDQGPEESIKHLQQETLEEYLDQPSEARKLEDVIPLDIDLDKSQSPAETPRVDDGGKHRQWFPPLPENVCISASQSESDAAEVPVSLSELSSSFEECFRALNERKGSRQNQRTSQDGDYNLELKPFDYVAAGNEMKFGGAREEGKADDDGIMNSSDFGDLRKSFGLSGPNSGDKVREFQMPRRRQAFPASGNRSMTYR